MNLKTALPPVVVAVLGLGALAGVQGTGFREQVEAQLTESAQGALSAAGLTGVEVRLTGRDAAVTAPTDSDALEAAGLVAELDGIRVAAAYGPSGPVLADETEPATGGPAAEGEPEKGEPDEGEPDEGEGGSEATEPTREEREVAQEDLAQIPDITFVTDSAKLTEDGHEVVRGAAEVLGAHPEVEVRIEGHTDSVGSEQHNQELSEHRAEQVLGELVELGVDRDRLTSKGFGESAPIVVPLTFADLEKNRRVEFSVQD